MSTPKRVIFNFVAKCNMNCTFCYVPFDGLRASAALAFDVLHRVLAWDIQGLVIGGGDPLMYNYTADLIAEARRARPGLFIQLDTNARRMSFDRLVDVTDKVDLIGLPVDAVRHETGLAMRADAAHGPLMLAVASRLASHGRAVKINTVVSALNWREIPRIRRHVEASDATIWSLYQFWAIGQIATSNASRHAIPTEAFERILLHQRARMRGRTVIESSGRIADRAGSYFFIAPTGRSFSTTPDGQSFIELGNILDNEQLVLERWSAFADVARNAVRSSRRAAIVNSPRHTLPELEV